MRFENLISPPVHKKLSSLKFALRAHLAGRGTALVLVALVAAVFFSFAIDRKLELEQRLQRILITLAALGGVGYVVWRYLLRPLRVPMTLDELALVLERHYPKLDDRLISTLDFSFQDMAGVGASEALIRRVAEQANSLAEGLDSRAPVRGRETWIRLAVATGAVAILVTFSAVRARDMGPWFMRNVLFQNVPYPRQTNLTEVRADPGFKVARGGSIEITVVADPQHVVPEFVTVLKKYPGLGDQDEDVYPSVRATLAEYLVGEGHSRDAAIGATDAMVALAKKLGKPVSELSAEAILSASAEFGSGAARRLRRPNVFVTTFKDITQPFEFRVIGNDHTTRWYQIDVVDPPELVKLSFTVDFPAYMKEESEPVSAAHGVLIVPPGSTITLDGTANKDLVSGQLWLGDRRAGDPLVPVPSGPGRSADTTGRRRIKGAVTLPDRVEESSLTLRVELTDTAGIANPRGAVYVLRIDPDRAPLVYMDRQGVRGDISARARIPLVIQVRDDHGVGGIEVSMTATAPPITTASAPAGEPVETTFAVQDVPIGEAEVQVTHDLDIQPMKLPIGHLVRVRATASDTLPASFGGPNLTHSAVHTFKIVPDAELLSELIRRQKEIRDEFRRTVDLQAAARDRLRAARDVLAKGANIDAEVRRKLSATAADQFQIAAQCAVAAKQMRDIRDEISANRIGTPVQQRNLLEKIIQPLEEVAEKAMPPVAESLIRASKETDAESLREYTVTSSEILDGFYSRLEAILKQMQKEQSRQELVTWLKQILGDSEQVEKIIEKHLDEERGTIWEPQTRPAR